jgi:hypothetical protein
MVNDGTPHIREITGSPRRLSDFFMGKRLIIGRPSKRKND